MCFLDGWLLFDEVVLLKVVNFRLFILINIETHFVHKSTIFLLLILVRAFFVDSGRVIERIVLGRIKIFQHVSVILRR